MKRLMDKLIMYHEIHRFYREGIRPSQIARQMVLDTRTVKKILTMNEQEYLDYQEKLSSRDKVLDPFESFVRSRLEACPDASAAQLHDWLKEHFTDLPDVTEKTVFNFVLMVRGKHGIPKPFCNHRDYEMVDELPYGKQAQVDFGEYNMTTEDNKRKKVYFFCMSLSRSRFKFLWLSEKPFTTLITITAHEKAFQYLGGIPQIIVYDQDTLMLVNENKGELILTDAFRSYVTYRGFKLHFCHKSDPQSKGKIENVVKYVKYNFLRGRIFVNVDTLNGQGMAWLSRTANAKVHAATKKIPHQQWLIEKEFLHPVSEIFTPQEALKSVAVTKVNVINYKGNYYRVPLGTHRGTGTKAWIEISDDNRLLIYDAENNQIASHQISTGKGRTIGGSHYKRDRSSKINELIDQLASLFGNPDQAKEYLLQIREDMPRNIRDQALHIEKQIKRFDMDVINRSLDFCIENKIFRATDFESVAEKFHAEKQQSTEPAMPITIKTLNHAEYKITPNKSNISDYQSLMN
ncbi:MAG: IS21 family transposase [Lentimicrobium sp.]|nr:IS21 family transposase [Lentimicrobium sp.]